MNSNAKLIAAGVVVGVAVVGLLVLRPGPGPATGQAGRSPFASASATGGAPPLTETFTSSVHGLTIAYPAGWTVVPSKEPWTTQRLRFESPADLLYHPDLEDHLFIGLASRTLGGEDGTDWATAYLADSRGECDAIPVPVTVDGVDGLACLPSQTLALTWIGDRMYVIHLYSSGDEPSLTDSYNGAWFEDLLASVQLRPEDAVDPSPAP